RAAAPYGVVTAEGKPGTTALSNRYYLADASFLVGLESEDDDELLQRLHQALLRPRWQIFLGRKAFVPSLPVWLPDGLSDAPLLDSLRGYPLPPRVGEGEGSPLRLRAVVEAEPSDESVEVRQDVPLSFATRRFAIRRVRTLWIDNPEGGS
ncbi:MAG: type I-E CRISPR-associated protein Cas5/CasD, partial [Pyrinomonadaceae bacterium]